MKGHLDIVKAHTCTTHDQLSFSQLKYINKMNVELFTRRPTHHLSHGLQKTFMVNTTIEKH